MISLLKHILVKLQIANRKRLSCSRMLEVDIRMTKFALISHILPPSPSGQAVMLYRILSRISENNYYLINTEISLSSGGNDADDRNRLPWSVLFPASRTGV